MLAILGCQDARPPLEAPGARLRARVRAGASRNPGSRGRRGSWAGKNRNASAAPQRKGAGGNRRVRTLPSQAFPRTARRNEDDRTVPFPGRVAWWPRTASIRRSRANSRGSLLRVKSCSQIRITRQPRTHSVRVTSRSRAWLPARFLAGRTGSLAWAFLALEPATFAELMRNSLNVVRPQEHMVRKGAFDLIGP